LEYAPSKLCKKKKLCATKVISLLLYKFATGGVGLPGEEDGADKWGRGRHECGGRLGIFE
jgi:hypothetical protein